MVNIGSGNLFLLCLLFMFFELGCFQRSDISSLDNTEVYNHSEAQIYIRNHENIPTNLNVTQDSSSQEYPIYVNNQDILQNLTVTGAPSIQKYLNKLESLEKKKNGTKTKKKKSKKKHSRKRKQRKESKRKNVTEWQLPAKPSQRRRNRVRKRKQSPGMNNNILEITTAKGVSQNRTIIDSSKNEIIQSLNKDPQRKIRPLKKKRKKIALNGNSTANLHFSGEKVSSSATLTSKDNTTTNKRPRKRKKRYNRCAKKNGGCSHKCKRKGKQKCSCFPGFRLLEDKKSCEDINECEKNNGGCQTTCKNNLGSYQCHCSEGYRLAYDMKSCIDINECLLRNGHGECDDTCTNTIGSFTCGCEHRNGTKLSYDGRSCVDIDECSENNGGCSHHCLNVYGQYFCYCSEGWEKSSDDKTCQDINECDPDIVQAYCNHTCTNTEGSFKCVDNTQMINDQSSLQNTVCQPLSLPSKGHMNCSVDGWYAFFTRTGRKRSMNSVGTNCKLMCPVGYRIVGEYDVTCDLNGEWFGSTNGKCIISPPPTLECPPDQSFTIDKSSSVTKVKFPIPITNQNWKYVKAEPAWAENLQGELTEGRHIISFFVKDPKSQLTASCKFEILVQMKLD